MCIYIYYYTCVYIYIIPKKCSDRLAFFCQLFDTLPAVLFCLSPQEKQFSRFLLPFLVSSVVLLRDRLRLGLTLVQIDNISCSSASAPGVSFQLDETRMAPLGGRRPGGIQIRCLHSRDALFQPFFFFFPTLQSVLRRALLLSCLPRHLFTLSLFKEQE